MKYLAIIVITILVLGTLFSLFSYGEPSNREQNKDSAAQTQEPQAPAATDKVNVEDIKTGSGAEAKSGNTVSVNYLGTFLDGTKFDSSYDRGESFSFVLGQGQVIRGWDWGVLGMRVGGKRKLVIPPSLAYGAQGIPGAIPPDSTLVFEVELLGVK